MFVTSKSGQIAVTFAATGLAFVTSKLMMDKSNNPMASWTQLIIERNNPFAKNSLKPLGTIQKLALGFITLAASAITGHSVGLFSSARFTTRLDAPVAVEVARKVEDVIVKTTEVAAHLQVKELAKLCAEKLKPIMEQYKLIINDAEQQLKSFAQEGMLDLDKLTTQFTKDLKAFMNPPKTSAS